MNLQSCCCSSSPLLPLPNRYSAAHFCILFPAKTKHHLLFSPPYPTTHTAAAASADSHVSSSPEGGRKLASELFDDDLLARVSAAADAAEVLRLISEQRGGGGVVTPSDCSLVISAALDRGNADLALSVFYAMRSSFDSGWVENATSLDRWKWSRPDVDIYTLLVKGLAASLRVSDALRMVDCVCRVGVSPGEEVPFGKVVRCPSCMIAVAVAQPQQGVQVVSCSKCRYQYELVSGNILAIESEEIRHLSARCICFLLEPIIRKYNVYGVDPGIFTCSKDLTAERSMDIPAWKRGLQFLQIMKQNIPAAVHSIVVETPSGLARTHRFATETVDLPAQEGERVTVAVAAPSNVYREVGPLKLSPKVPNFYPGEPMCLTNHKDGRESRLIRAPPKDVAKSIWSPTILFPILAVFATGDAASGMLDPSLPQLIAAATFSSLAVGVTFSSLILPQLNKLPQRLVDITSVRQQLLSQYDLLQSRIKELKKAAKNEVWMLARMCQLENKIYAVGEPSYRARRTRVKKVREGLESSLKTRIELIESYARISSMIEIEVELDVDVIAAEAVSNVENIAQQIEQIMEIENLEEKWRLQAEANDEAERLLSSEPIPSDQIAESSR